MSDEMIQRVARAIYAKRPYYVSASSAVLTPGPLRSYDWDHAPTYYRTDCMEIARAAIEAMREPTEYMLSHALAEGAWCTANSWRSMIDAALPPLPGS
jgi:hypothetical protein